MLKQFDRFYTWWVHPNLKGGIFNEHLSRQMVFLSIAEIFSYFPLYFFFQYSGYPHGVLACLIGLPASFSTLLLLRYSAHLKFNYYFSLTRFLFLVFLVGYGAGGIRSSFAFVYIFMIWAAIYCDLKGGLIWTGFLICWLIFWVVLEFNGFEFPNTFPQQYLQGFNLGYVFFIFIIYTFVFGTAKLNEQRLMRKLEKSNELLFNKEKMASLGQLTAGIAHEINNPVNFINGSVEAMELDLNEIHNILNKLHALQPDPGHNDEVNNLLKLVKQANLKMIQGELSELLNGVKIGSQRVTDIVKGLRTFTHTSDADPQMENLSDIINAALIILANNIKAKGIVVDKNYKDTPKVLCHAGKMNQVFVNIIDNAIDALPPNGNLDIQIYQQSNHVVCKFSDNGIGISAANLKRVFDPFFTTKEVGKGTGLGMAISYGIVKDHFGEIDIESQLDQGTTIIISLPIDH